MLGPGIGRGRGVTIGVAVGVGVGGGVAVGVAVGVADRGAQHYRPAAAHHRNAGLDLDRARRPQADAAAADA